MEITIKIGGRMVSVKVSAEVKEFWEQGKRSSRKLYREQQRYWDGRECDEYIIAAEGLLPYQPTPEDIACQRETLAQLLSILDSCTAIQRERFLLYALYGYSYAEIAILCGCSKVSVFESIEAVRKKFLKFFENHPNDWPYEWLTK